MHTETIRARMWACPPRLPFPHRYTVFIRVFKGCNKKISMFRSEHNDKSCSSKPRIRFELPARHEDDSARILSWWLNTNLFTARYKTWDSSCSSRSDEHPVETRRRECRHIYIFHQIDEKSVDRKTLCLSHRSRPIPTHCWKIQRVLLFMFYKNGIHIRTVCARIVASILYLDASIISTIKCRLICLRIETYSQETTWHVCQPSMGFKDSEMDSKFDATSVPVFEREARV